MDQVQNNQGYLKGQIIKKDLLDVVVDHIYGTGVLLKKICVIAASVRGITRVSVIAEVCSEIHEGIDGDSAMDCAFLGTIKSEEEHSWNMEDKCATIWARN